MSNLVVDASAILALLKQEFGSESVLPNLSQACISTVNVSERELNSSAIAVFYNCGFPPFNYAIAHHQSMPTIYDVTKTLNFFYLPVSVGFDRVTHQHLLGKDVAHN